MKILNLLLALFSISFSSGYSIVLQEFKETFVKSREATIYCKVFGRGDPVVVVHVVGTSYDYLLPQMAKLAETNDVIFYWISKDVAFQQVRSMQIQFKLQLIWKT